MSKEPNGWTEHRFASLGSTMDAATDLAETGAPDRTVVRADLQTGARGRYGRTWISEAGNYYATLILREERPLAQCAQLSFAASLAVLEALPVETEARLKWPNDVLVARKKIAGILLEAGGTSSAPWILIGIGINVSHFPEDMPYPATGLMAEGQEMDLDTLNQRVLTGIDRWREIWRAQGPKVLFSTWMDSAQGRGERIRVRLSDREIEGMFETLDDEGRLIVLQEDGSRFPVAAGDVYFG